MTQVIDDQLLAMVIIGEDPPQADQEIFTTGCWYFRLCRAVLNRTTRDGAISRRFRNLPPERRDVEILRLIELPETVGVESLRTLVPLMSQMHLRHKLNLLGCEALAAAVHLDASVFLSTSSPPLERVLEAEKVAVEVVL